MVLKGKKFPYTIHILTTQAHAYNILKNFLYQFQDITFHIENHVEYQVITIYVEDHIITIHIKDHVDYQIITIIVEDHVGII